MLLGEAAQLVFPYRPAFTRFPPPGLPPPPGWVTPPEYVQRPHLHRPETTELVIPAALQCSPPPRRLPATAPPSLAPHDTRNRPTFPGPSKGATVPVIRNLGLTRERGRDEMIRKQRESKQVLDSCAPPTNDPEHTQISNWLDEALAMAGGIPDEPDDYQQTSHEFPFDSEWSSLFSSEGDETQREAEQHEFCEYIVNVPPPPEKFDLPLVPLPESLREGAADDDFSHQPWYPFPSANIAKNSAADVLAWQNNGVRIPYPPSKAEGSDSDRFRLDRIVAKMTCPLGERYVHGNKQKTGFEVLEAHHKREWWIAKREEHWKWDKSKESSRGKLDKGSGEERKSVEVEQMGGKIWQFFRGMI